MSSYRMIQKCGKIVNLYNNIRIGETILKYISITFYIDYINITLSRDEFTISDGVCHYGDSHTCEIRHHCLERLLKTLSYSYVQYLKE